MKRGNVTNVQMVLRSIFPLSIHVTDDTLALFTGDYFYDSASLSSYFGDISVPVMNIFI